MMSKREDFNLQAPILPESGDFALVAMRFKEIELCFCFRPTDSDEVLFANIKRLRELVVDLQNAG